MTYSTSQLAELLSLTAASVRNYTHKFSRHLLPAARPGQPRRRFTIQDVRILACARAMLAAGLTYAEVDQRLDEGVTALMFEFGIELPDLELEPEPQPEQPAGPLVSAEQLRMWLSPLQRALEEWRSIAEERRIDLERKEAEIQRLREELERQRRPWWRRLFGG